jgi:predicted transcriptional regulator
VPPTDRGRSKDVLTPLELQIMQVLWEAGAATVADVQARLPGELAYTTVQTMLNVLLKKKKVKRTEAGRAFRYQPAVTRERATGAALDDLVTRMFGGSAQALLMALVDAKKVTPEDIERASRLLKTRKAEDE